jgi:hypothetical protein
VPNQSGITPLSAVFLAPLTLDGLFKQFVKPIPRAVRKAGLVGPRLTALIGYLKGACHCSFSTIRKLLQDVVGVGLSRGQLRKLCWKVARSLDQPYQDLLAALPEQARLNVDETGHKENGRGLWTWCFRAPLFTLFKIDPSRGSDVLLDVLGTEFDGVLGCDYFSAYRKYLRLNENVLVQFCLAHLIRDVRFLGEHPNSKNLAEQAIRFVVIDRRVTQGSRSLAGRKWLERIWTAIATCTQHGQSVFAFLNQTVQALFADTPAPTLLFGTS